MASASANQAANRTDPTRTKTARGEFAQHLRGRWDAIKWHITSGVIDNDAFGLSPGSGIPLATHVADQYNLATYSSEELHQGLQRGFAETYDLQDPTGPELAGSLFRGYVEADPEITPGYREWADLRDAEATARFDDWLDGALEREILEQYEGDTYVRQGYAKGVKHADTGLRRAGLADPDPGNVQAVIRRPVHRDELERIFSRTYQSLDGVTEAAANEMRRELADGLAQGQNPRKIARSLNGRVEAVGKTRSTVVAKTSVIRAHSESTLTRLESVAGDVSVTVKAEHRTAGDRRVCDTCASLEGEIYTLKEARGTIPVHPQCRCVHIPIQRK